jgi:NADP-dependent 3-hydroxy acid dehydrogenase YdfG
LRGSLTKRYVRVSLVEPGPTSTELAFHNRQGVLEELMNQFVQPMEPDDVADAIAYIVTRSRRVAVNEILVRPTEMDR